MPDRPFGEIEAVHQQASQEPNFLARAQRLRPGGDDDLARFQPLRDHDGSRVVAQDIDAAQGHGLALRIDDPHGRAPVCLGERARRDLHAGRRRQRDAAGDGGSQPHGLGRIDDADLDLERPGRGIRLGRNLPHAAGGLHLRVVGQRDLDHRVARARPDELLGHVEDGVAPALARDLHNHPPGTDHFARFGADRGDRTGGIGGQHRVAQLLLRDAHLRPSGVDLGLSVSKLCWASSKLARDVQPSFNSSCCRQKVMRASFSCASTDARLACAERSAFCWICGSSRATTWPAATTSPTLTGRSIMRPSRRKARLTWSLARTWPGQRDDLASGTLLDGDRPDGPGLGGRRRRLVATRDGRGDEQDRYGDPTLGHWLSLPIGAIDRGVPAG